MKNTQHITFLKNQLKISELYALFHIHSASNGHCLSKNIYHGKGYTKFTDQEKINNAMEIAKRHIRHCSEISDTLSTLEQ